MIYIILFDLGGRSLPASTLRSLPASTLRSLPASTLRCYTNYTVQNYRAAHQNHCKKWGFELPIPGPSGRLRLTISYPFILICFT